MMNRVLWMGLAVGALGCSSDYKVEAAASSFSVTPNLSDLGVVTVGETLMFAVQISHTGGADVGIVSAEVINVEGTFFSNTDAAIPEVVESEGSADIFFNYIPEADGYHYGRIIIKTDASEEPERMVEMRAQAASPVLVMYPSIIDFGPVAVGTSSVETVTVVNEGTIAVVIDELPVDNDVFGGTLALPYRIEPGEKIDVPFEFAPEDLEEQTADASVSLSAGVSFSGLHLRGNACSTASGSLYDQDGDGYSVCGTDCNDGNPDVRPGADEVCNGLDDNCDEEGLIDEGTSCFDDDGDGQTEDEGDCNDDNPEIYVGAEEDMSNGMDDDCDGVVDSGATDLDGDGYSEEGGDCAPYDSSIYPGAPEDTSFGVDNDCDGTVDEGTIYYDDDGDGLSEVEGDCDDTDDRITPEGVEIADWLDNDCDGMVDEGTIHADDDGDGFSELGGDCDDTNPIVNPGYPEIPDGIDNDCDGVAL